MRQPGPDYNRSAQAGRVETKEEVKERTGNTNSIQQKKRVSVKMLRWVFESEWMLLKGREQRWRGTTWKGEESDPENYNK